jgi:Flp pilus assembly protein TadG
MRRGATTVEFLVVAIVFFLLVFGAVQFSRALVQYNVVSNATKSSVRWAAVRVSSAGQTPATPTQVHDYIATQMYGYSETDSVSWNPDASRGSTVQVVVRSSYTTSIPLMPSFTLPMRSAAQMIIAR